MLCCDNVVKALYTRWEWFILNECAEMNGQPRPLTEAAADDVLWDKELARLVLYFVGTLVYEAGV